jgi:hypothetical protein
MERENKFRKTFEKMEGFRVVTPVTGLNSPNTGKEDDEKSMEIYQYWKLKCWWNVAIYSYLIFS